MSTIKVELQGSTAVVTPGVALWDELDTNKFRAVLNELLAKADIKKIILNLHSVSHLNSTALGILVQTYAEIQSTPRSLILCEVKKQVGNIFEVTKLNTILDIRPKLVDAFDDDYHQRGVDQKSKLSYTFEQRDDSMIVHMDGHLMGGPDSEKLSTACKAHLEDSRVQRLVLDLADMRYVSQAGLGCLIGIYTAAKERKKGCVTYQVSPRIQRFLVVTKLDTILKAIDTL